MDPGPGTPLNDLVVLITCVVTNHNISIVIISLGALFAGYFQRK